VPPTVTVKPVIVPRPSTAKLIVNVVPVPPVGMVIVAGPVWSVYAEFRGANESVCVPLDLHDFIRLLVVVYVPVSELSSHIVGDKSYGVNPLLKNWDVGTRGVSSGGGNL